MRTIDADALIEDLNRFFPSECVGNITPKTLFAQILTDIDNAPTVEQPTGEWIPVSERLPNCNGCYIVTRIIEETAISDVCYFDGQNPIYQNILWYNDNRVNHGRPYPTDITAWQPLPEPYKKGGEGE